MYSPGGLPIKSTPGRHPDESYPTEHRHRSARRIAHRVRESLTSRIVKMVCALFLGLLLVVGILSFILWLSLRPHRPRFHIQEFSIPGLDQATGFQNAQISFNVTIRNSNQNIGIYYGSMEGSVYYVEQRVGSKPLLYPSYQEPKSTIVVADTLSGNTLAVDSQRWAEFAHDRAAGAVNFRLEIVATIRFKISTWESKPHRAHANCEVSLGSDGQMSPIFKDKRCPVYFT